MSVVLPYPTQADLSPPPTAYTSGWEWDNHDGSPLTISLTNLVPGHLLRVSMLLGLYPVVPGGVVTVVVGDEVSQHLEASAVRVTKTARADSPTMEILILGARRARFNTTDPNNRIEDLTPLPANPKPAHVLSLQAFLPVSGVDAFRLGQSRLGRDSLTAGRAPEDLFALGKSKLGTKRLFYREALKAWQDITRPCTQIATSRGVDATGVIRKARAGTFEAHALDGLDPRIIGMHRGTPITLIHWPTRRVIFTGTVIDLNLVPHRPGGRHSYHVDITAADAVADLVGITRYGARAETADGQEPWSARIERLSRSAPTRWNLLLGNTTPMAPLVWETSLANHLDAAVTSVGGWWYAATTGEIIIAPGTVPPADTGLVLTDAVPTDLAHSVWSYIDVDNRWQASNLITSIEGTNHSATVEDGEWRADDLEVTVQSDADTWVYGGSKATATTTLGLPVHIAPLLTSLLRASSEDPPPQKVTLAAAGRYGPADRSLHMAVASGIDAMEKVEVTSRGDCTKALITTVQHEITPTTWQTDLTLTTP